MWVFLFSFYSGKDKMQKNIQFMNSRETAMLSEKSNGFLLLFVKKLGTIVVAFVQYVYIGCNK